MVAANIEPDLGMMRRLSPETLALFNVRNNGTGWLWTTMIPGGGVATRWKSYYSTRDTAPVSERETWAKYRWEPTKPDGANYFSPGGLTTAIRNANGVLYLVGGEVDVMTMYEVGIPNATCFFGDGTMPPTLLNDLLGWGVKEVRMIPDRDKAGESNATKVRNALRKSLEIELKAYALPYELTPKHGGDINDFWVKSDGNPLKFRESIITLPIWHLPEPPEPTPTVIDFDFKSTDEDLPPKFVLDLKQRLNVNGSFNSEGWAQKNVLCPFHDEEHPSATWNDVKKCLRCHRCDQTWNAKQVGEQVGIILRDYFDTPIPIAPIKREPTPAPVKIEEPKPVAKSKVMRPPLPAYAELNESQQRIANDGRIWLDQYIEWAVKSSPLTPRIIHEAIGLWLLASVSTRRLKLCLGGEDIYSNLYVFIVAKTTLYRKTSAMKLATKILDWCNLNSLRMASEATPEAMLESLAGIKPTNYESLSEEDRRDVLLSRAFAAQRTFIKDEASSVLASIKKEYMQGLVEILLSGYDGDAGKITKNTKSGGLITVRDICLSFLGATTPVMWAKHVGTEEQENGFLARFAVITPERAPDYSESPDEIELPTGFIKQIRNLFMNVLPWDKRLLNPDGKPSINALLDEMVTPPVMSVAIAPQALEQLKNYRKAMGWDMLAVGNLDDSKSASYARLGTMAVKVAILLAAIDTEQGVVRILPCHAAAAQEIVEGWRESLHRLDLEILRSTDSEISERVLSYLKAAGELGVTIREIMRDMKIKTRSHAMEVLKLLAEEGLIEQFSHKPAGAGRPSQRYRFGTESSDKGSR